MNVTVTAQQKESSATIPTQDTSRTARLLALMKKGDDAFNARDFAAVDEVHHPDMVAYIPGLAEPVYGREAHAAAMTTVPEVSPTCTSTRPVPIRFGSGDWITVVANVTGTFAGEITLSDGRRSLPRGRHSTSSSDRRPGGTATG